MWFHFLGESVVSDVSGSLHPGSDCGLLCEALHFRGGSPALYADASARGRASERLWDNARQIFCMGLQSVAVGLRGYMHAQQSYFTSFIPRWVQGSAGALRTVSLSESVPKIV